jgi:hypothetical protein
MAALRSLLHLVPLGGAIALLILNWTQYFVGTHFSGATTLQFLAKFHELLMQTSIVELVICIIRTQAVNGFIPLGALSASMQAFQVSYLWSLDYVSAITSKAFYGWRKAAFVIAIPLLIFLTALVGPSSAILMIPRPGTPRELGSLVFYPNASQENMFPSHVNETRGLKL